MTAAKSGYAFVRLKPSLLEAVDKAARAQKLNRSNVIRLAIEMLVHGVSMELYWQLLSYAHKNNVPVETLIHDAVKNYLRLHSYNIDEMYGGRVIPDGEASKSKDSNDSSNV